MFWTKFIGDWSLDFGRALFLSQKNPFQLDPYATATAQPAIGHLNDLQIVRSGYYVVQLHFGPPTFERLTSTKARGARNCFAKEK